MERYKRFLEKLHEHVQRDWDRLMPVIGEEGAGKSTLILQSIWLYEQIRGNDPTPESVLDYIVFDDRDAFKQKLLTADAGDPIGVMDAAHILYNKDVMMPDQKDVEKSLLDIRTENYVIFLGYQDWGDIPDQLRKRRAKNVIQVPSRGTIKGYNRRQLDEKYHKLDDMQWPDHALTDTFPSLEGTRLWKRFDEVDKERKRRRLQQDDDSDAELTPQDVVGKIVVEDALEEYVEVNEFQKRAYYSKSLLRYDYPDLSDQQADQVRSALTREADPETLADLDGTDTPPPTGEGKS
ncbi:hypothetical protein [Haladaptatus cibarius]|uniref:hypothetical protein n=1 Tax=Haladaptatus cibarius TaxID=453847 RepID=UPI00067878C2|nr:hypothetical protein [Haladaptatus cibarius]